uniref:Uncharacterized protein n=1 Tax=Steinernema glaseri TaxID=37863 RepID=A0A1I7Y4R9_9BILA
MGEPTRINGSWKRRVKYCMIQLFIRHQGIQEQSKAFGPLQNLRLQNIRLPKLQPRPCLQYANEAARHIVLDELRYRTIVAEAHSF